MKLAEALSQRKDLQIRISQLEERLKNNVKVQDGDEPFEDPKELFKELDRSLVKLEELIFKINKTNMLTTTASGKTLTQLMAERDVLGMRVRVLRSVFDHVSSTHDRYSRTEIKYNTTIDVKALHKQVDQYAQKFRELDMELQAINFSVDLMD